MSICQSKILFLHGLNSSKESNKFQAINAAHKFCINVDYFNLTFQAVTDFYSDIIEKIKPQIIVGHSLGGYWALKMSKQHQIPCIIANPSLQPNFRHDYPAISDEDLNHDIPQFAYLELGDEMLDMHAAKEFLENYMQIVSTENGQHRLDHPEKLNELIAELEKTI